MRIVVRRVCERERASEERGTAGPQGHCGEEPRSGGAAGGNAEGGGIQAATSLVHGVVSVDAGRIPAGNLCMAAMAAESDWGERCVWVRRSPGGRERDVAWSSPTWPQRTLCLLMAPGAHSWLGVERAMSFQPGSGSWTQTLAQALAWLILLEGRGATALSLGCKSSAGSPAHGGWRGERLRGLHSGAWHEALLGQACCASRIFTAEIFSEGMAEKERGLRLAADRGSWGLWSRRARILPLVPGRGAWNTEGCCIPSVIRLALHVTLHRQAQVLALVVEPCSCIGAGGDSGAADWGPEPAGARIATWFWEGPRCKQHSLSSANRPGQNNPSTTRLREPLLGGLGSGEGKFNLWYTRVQQSRLLLRPAVACAQLCRQLPLPLPHLLMTSAGGAAASALGKDGSGLLLELEALSSQGVKLKGILLGQDDRRDSGREVGRIHIRELWDKSLFWMSLSRSAPIPLLLPGLGSEQSKNHRGDDEVGTTEERTLVAECQTGQGEERAARELVQDSGGLMGGSWLPEAWATPALPPDWPGEGATMLGQRTQSAGFVEKTEGKSRTRNCSHSKAHSSSLGVLEGIGGNLWLFHRPWICLLACWLLACSSLPPSASHPSMAQKQMVVLALGLPMTHLKQSQGCCPSPRGPSRAGREGRQGRQSWQQEAPQKPRLLLLQAWKEDAASSSWTVSGLAPGQIFTLPGHPHSLGHMFPFSLRSLQDRESVFLLEMAGTRSKEAKSRSPPPAPALPGPSRPHPGPGGAEWVGMAQNKKLIKSVSHLHPKIKERRKTSSDNSHAASGPGGPPSGNGGDMCRRPGPGPHPSSPVRRPQPERRRRPSRAPSSQGELCVSGNAGQGASAGTLDARAPGRDTEGPSPLRCPPPTPPGLGCVRGGPGPPGRRQRRLQRGGPPGPPGRPSAGERRRESAGELETESKYLSGSRLVPELSSEPRGTGEGKFFHGKEWERKSAACWGPRHPRPREPSSPNGGCPLGDPRARLPGGRDSGQGRRSSLTSGLKLLWAELREASAEASVSRGSSRLRARRGAGDMVRDRPGRRAVRAPRRGPSPGVAPPLPRAPLSSGGTEFGFLERCQLGDEGVVLESACLLPSRSLSGPSLLPQPPSAPAPMPSFLRLRPQLRAGGCGGTQGTGCSVAGANKELRVWDGGGGSSLGGKKGGKETREGIKEAGQKLAPQGSPTQMGVGKCTPLSNQPLEFSPGLGSGRKAAKCVSTPGSCPRSATLYPPSHRTVKTFAWDHSLQTFPFGLSFEAGLSSEERGGHLQIEMREKASVREGLQPVWEFRKGPVAGGVGSKALPGRRKTSDHPNPPRPALTGVATGRQPEPRRRNAASEHLLGKQGRVGKEAVPPALGSLRRPYTHLPESNIPKASMLRRRSRKWAWPLGPRATLRGKPEAAILSVIFIQGPRHLGLSYGIDGQNCFPGFFGRGRLFCVCIFIGDYNLGGSRVLPD
ncbi:hypothetical protein Cadr_000005740 [Camelus dromedarius]|uniref:Uncharacterized protein n=1 Tax=Camelus dromedarius TaxID=9838 RepID=A0A5N4E1V0_CAMDR|nr:hypothetical protein Cadr_000005740 [Camelus dromedarius]